MMEHSSDDVFRKFIATGINNSMVQRIAWGDHGFRSGLVGVTNDPATVNLSFMPETIDSVISLPAPKAMHRIVQALETRSCRFPWEAKGATQLLLPTTMYRDTARATTASEIGKTLAAAKKASKCRRSSSDSL